MKRGIRIVFLSLLLALLLPGKALAYQEGEEPVEVIEISSPQVEYHTKEEIRQFARDYPADTQKKDTFKKGKKPVLKPPYDPGEMSDQSIRNALNMLNRMRFIAGVPADVEIDEEYQKKAQAGAMINAVNKRVTHTPERPEGMDDELYDLCCEGTRFSNLGQGFRNCCDTFASGYIHDGVQPYKPTTIGTVGHRRRLISPRMKKTGLGSAGEEYAMYSGDSNNRTEVKENGVVWPAQVMPVEYFSIYDPWSVSFMNSIENPDDISVTLTRTRKNGKVKMWKFSTEHADGLFEINYEYRGDPNTILFWPKNLKKVKASDRFHVEIEGLETGFFSYDVKFFHL